MNWYDDQYMKTQHLAINPSPTLVLFTYRSLLMGMLIRCGHSLTVAKDVTNQALFALQQRIQKGMFPNDIQAWLLREIKRNKGASFLVQPLSKMDEFSILYAVSHPILTPISRGILCIHLLGGIPNNRLIPIDQSPVLWTERLQRALRALNISVSSDILSFEASYNSREAVILDTLYRSLILCDKFCFSDLRTYLIQLFVSLQPSLYNVSEALAFQAWYMMQDGCRYARLFASELRHQNRSYWNQEQIAQGRAILEQARSLSFTWGPHLIRSSVLALHLESPSYDKTPWHDVMRLELMLLSFDNTTEQLLAYIEALGHIKGPEYVLPYVKDQDLSDYRWIHAQAQLLKKLGRKQDALVLYQHALHSAPDQEHEYILNDMVDL